MQEQVSFTITEKKVGQVRISKSTKERQGRLLAENKCLACESEIVEGERVIRGQCQACYCASRRAVRLNRYTDSDLIRAGVLLPAGTGGRKPANEYARRLAEGSI